MISPSSSHFFHSFKPSRLNWLPFLIYRPFFIVFTRMKKEKKTLRYAVSLLVNQYWFSIKTLIDGFWRNVKKKEVLKMITLTIIGMKRYLITLSLTPYLFKSQFKMPLDLLHNAEQRRKVGTRHKLIFNEMLQHEWVWGCACYHIILFRILWMGEFIRKVSVLWEIKKSLKFAFTHLALKLSPRFFLHNAVEKQERKWKITKFHPHER